MIVIIIDVVVVSVHVGVLIVVYCIAFVLFFQAEDGIRDLVRSRGLGDVYKRQLVAGLAARFGETATGRLLAAADLFVRVEPRAETLSLIHI